MNFDIPVGYPAANPEICLPELEVLCGRNLLDEVTPEQARTHCRVDLFS
jgi:hypothetical protein